MSDLDLKLVGGSFMTEPFPLESVYLYKYFKSDLGRMFVVYYFMFEKLIDTRNTKFFLDNFVDHTGMKCSEQRLRYLLKKLQFLVDKTNEAKSGLNFEALGIIKSGKYNVVRKNLESINAQKEI